MGRSTEETYVFVHGVRDQGRSWDHFLEELISRGVPIKHAVALDLRGHGDSEWPSTSRGYQHEDFLTDLAGLLKHLDKEPLTIIGHSLGGSMCLLYAGTFPERVKRMVLLESLGPFARADDEVPDIIAERLKGRNYVEIPFPHESLEAAAKAIQKTFPLIPDHAALHMARHGTQPKAAATAGSMIRFCATAPPRRCRKGRSKRSFGGSNVRFFLSTAPRAIS